jgi:hypothetical protein
MVVQTFIIVTLHVHWLPVFTSRLCRRYDAVYNQENLCVHNVLTTATYFVLAIATS